jgi:hypothetical protein
MMMPSPSPMYADKHQGKRKRKDEHYLSNVFCNSDMLSVICPFATIKDIRQLLQTNRLVKIHVFPLIIPHVLWYQHRLATCISPSDFPLVRKVGECRDGSVPRDQAYIPVPYAALTGLQQLTLPDSFNEDFVAGFLPSTLTHLTTGSKFNKPLRLGALPFGLKYLKVGTSFNQPIKKGELPGELRQLTFNLEFNQPIGVDVLPKNLQKLTFDDRFNQPIGIGVLPDALQRLQFGCDFNQRFVPGSLPTSLKRLALGKNYNQPFAAGVRPHSLDSLSYQM